MHPNVRTTFFVVLFIGSIVSNGLAQTSDPSDILFNQLKTSLDSAVNHAGREKLETVKDGFRNHLDSGDQEIKKLAHYYMGYADYRLSSLFEDMGKDLKGRYLDEAIEYLEKTIEMTPDFAEGWALLGNCYGMKATGVFSGMKYGPKSDRAIKKALQLSPENPRVITINGIALLHKPAIVGGSIEKAIDEFKMAAVFYRKQEVQDMYPDWGYAENYAWMAQAYIQLDQHQEALEALKKALEVDHDYYWVKEILLPELQKKLN